MRIVSKKEFMKLPIGTVWSYYEPCVFRDLNIKVSDLSEWETDFLYDGVIGKIDVQSSEDFTNKCELMEKGESVPMDFEQTSREGLFDDDQLFAIYEKEDVEKLIIRLQKCI
jgi:hypothetical protein